jgi:SRSO17 transposase
LGKSDNCQAAVSLSVSTANSSLPIAWRLYLPEVWCQDAERCRRAGVPEEVVFQTKPEIALEQIRQAMEQLVRLGVVLADAGYGRGTQFRTDLTQLGLQYAVGIESNATVWEPGQATFAGTSAKTRAGCAPNAPAAQCGPSAHLGKAVGPRLATFGLEGDRLAPGSEGTLRSRFAAVRVRPAHRDYKRTEPYPGEWLLIEWPKKESEPTKYWLSTLSEKTSLKSLVKITKHRWIIERDYEELKQELGLGHYEGRGWRGFHHHATLCIAAYGFLISERNRFSPSARIGNLGLSAPEPPPDFRPRGSPRPPRTP